jgi:hypothetical protein
MLMGSLRESGIFLNEDGSVGTLAKIDLATPQEDSKLTGLAKELADAQPLARILQEVRVIKEEEKLQQA